MSQTFCLSLAGALISLSVSAQPASQNPPVAVQAPQVQVSPYRSSFEGYQAYTEEKILPWKQANDTAGAIGGWRAYAKEANEPAQRADDQSSRPRPAQPQMDHVKP